MIRYLAPFLAALALPVPSIALADADVAVFTGPIDASTVAAFMKAHATLALRTVVLDSTGGDVEAAMDLADWIADRELDVEVEHVCASSCANYPFAAGVHRRIDDGALVLWHGSLLQKDFRDRGEACSGRFAAFAEEAVFRSDRYDARLDDERVYCTRYAALVARQAAFFARVGVDEAITRVGQEPHDFGAVWTVPIEAMAHFGLVVEASTDYGSPAYLRRSGAGARSFLSLAIDADGAVVEVVDADCFNWSSAFSRAGGSSRSSGGCP